ncbi:NEW3 domain-containing protein [Olivibacter sitiensis]|uniref:COG1470 family protein n=1 Tax=Olivibacter sitiensis TaxID=376470 RepID=UPI00041BF289|nr:NEW3 domain-containing protein [Olivibacter sitiensis]
MLAFLSLARAKKLKSCLVYLFFLGFMGSPSLGLAQGVTLYTPYTKISVPPGQSIDYSIDIINNGSAVRNASLTVVGLPKDWPYELKSGGWSVGQVSVLPKERKNVSLQVQVPYKVNKGSYTFQVVSPGMGQLPLTVVVSEQGTFNTEFNSTQPNMEGAANSTFTFNATLRNSTAEDQVYALQAQAPPGWNVSFKADYKQVSSVNIESYKTKDITIEIKPTDDTKAGKYKVPVIATTNGTSADLALEVVVTGSYAMELTTPSGLLSGEITAGDTKNIDLTVKNTGSAEIKNVQLQSSAPSKWEVTFEPQKIDNLIPGGYVNVKASIKADRKAIPGDYVVNIDAKAAETSSKVSFRMAVETSLLWGWLGILIVILALGAVYYLFKKYGRR